MNALRRPFHIVLGELLGLFDATNLIHSSLPMHPLSPAIKFGR